MTQDNAANNMGAAMSNPSPERNAAIRALRGESDAGVVRPALGCALAKVIALALGVHPVIRTIAALSSELTDLLDARAVADPALRHTVAHLIGTTEGRDILVSLSRIAPAGWGHAHVAALIDAVRHGMCNAGVAAALIGPDNAAAAIVTEANDCAWAIRRWGQLTPDAPTAWMHALSSRERDRLLHAVRQRSFAAASCLPWLPSNRFGWMRIHEALRDEDSVDVALRAFADASLTARSCHAKIMRRFVSHACTTNLRSLTHLACILDADDVWRRVQTLVQACPSDAYHVVAAAPWNALGERVREAILGRAEHFEVCAAIAAARGQPCRAGMTWRNAAAFFAALDPNVWNALDTETQRRWRDALLEEDAHLAVRSLGPRPEFLVRARLTNDLVRAVQRHAPDAAALHWALLPAALRDLPPDAAHDLIAALPMPPDPGAFFCIASRSSDSDIMTPARAALDTPDDLARAVVLQRCADNDGMLHDRCAALLHVLRGRSWDDLAPIMALFDDAARVSLMPDPGAITQLLAHPDKRELLFRTLAQLTFLSPDVLIPTRYALHRWGEVRADSHDSYHAAASIALALDKHGDVFLGIADTLAHDRQSVLLPLPKGHALADALRTLARDNPSSAQRLAHALRGRFCGDARHDLMHAPPCHAAVLWETLATTERRAIVSAISDVEPITETLDEHAAFAALALAAVRANDDDLRAAGVNALAARPDVLRVIWMQLPRDVQQALRSHPAASDMSLTSEHPVVHVRDDWRRSC